MFDNHDSPLTQKLSRHLRVYVYEVAISETLSALGKEIIDHCVSL